MFHLIHCYLTQPNQFVSYRNTKWTPRIDGSGPLETFLEKKTKQIVALILQLPLLVLNVNSNTMKK